MTSHLLKVLVARAKATLTTLTLYEVTLVDGNVTEPDADIGLSTAHNSVPQRY